MEVELQRVSLDVFDDLHQVVEHLWLQLADQGAEICGRGSGARAGPGEWPRGRAGDALRGG